VTVSTDLTIVDRWLLPTGDR